MGQEGWAISILIVLIYFLAENPVKWGVYHVEIGDFFDSGVAAFIKTASVADSTNTDLFEGHMVAGQRPSFVREDVGDLAEFFIETTLLDCSLCAILAAHQIGVPFYEDGLDILHRFNGHQERNGDKVTILRNQILKTMKDKLMALTLAAESRCPLWRCKSTGGKLSASNSCWQLFYCRFPNNRPCKHFRCRISSSSWLPSRRAKIGWWRCRESADSFYFPSATSSTEPFWNRSAWFWSPGLCKPRFRRSTAWFWEKILWAWNFRMLGRICRCIGSVWQKGTWRPRTNKANRLANRSGWSR